MSDTTTFTPPTTTSPATLGDTTSDWNGLIVAALTLVTVLIVCYMCVQLFKVRRPPTTCHYYEQLVASPQWTQYRPACSGQWLSDRRGECKGLTSGIMPSIEEDLPVSWAPCSGALGVPPPTYQ